MVHFIVFFVWDGMKQMHGCMHTRTLLEDCFWLFAMYHSHHVCLEDEVVQRKSKGAHGGRERERQKYTRSCSSWTDT